MKLQQALDAFLLEDRAQSTNDTYFKTLKKALAFLGPERDVDLVTREDILRYIKHLHNQVIRYENHPSRPPERGGLSPRTVEKHAKNLVTFFRWCEKNNLISKNPTTDLQLRRYHRPPGASKAATTEELQTILKVAESKKVLGKPKHLAIFLFLCDTGCRAGEAADLVIGNLDFEQMGGWVAGKGDKLRPIFFGPQTAEILKIRLKAHPNPTADETLFQISAASISQVIARLAKQAGIERPLGAHTIRHRVGQVWSAARMSEQATQLKLGHDDPSVTIEMYYNTTNDHIQQASQQLSLAAIYGLPTEPSRLSAPTIFPNKKNINPEGKSESEPAAV